MSMLSKQKSLQEAAQAQFNAFSNMPSMTEQPVDLRKEYLMLVASVASSDGYLDPREVTLLKRWIQDFKLNEKEGKEVMVVASKEDMKDRSSVEEKVRKSGLIVSLMLDLMSMAMADGVLADDEIDMLRAVSKSLGMDVKEFDVYLEFVHSAHQQATLFNPEPLFEHNIIAALKMMKSKKVQLYNHTLLCSTHPGYDQELKTRWNESI